MGNSSPGLRWKTTPANNRTGGVRWRAPKPSRRAQAQLKTLHVDRTRNDLPVLKRTPKFADYSAQYLAYFDSVKDAKRPATIQKERGVIKLWTKHRGGLRLDKIRRLHINSFIEKQQAQKNIGPHRQPRQHRPACLKVAKTAAPIAKRICTTP
jgi:hypothetical protein